MVSCELTDRNMRLQNVEVPWTKIGIDSCEATPSSSYSASLFYLACESQAFPFKVLILQGLSVKLADFSGFLPTAA
jgi:hypothetical protein